MSECIHITLGDNAVFYGRIRAYAYNLYASLRKFKVLKTVPDGLLSL